MKKMYKLTAGLTVAFCAAVFGAQGQTVLVSEDFSSGSGTTPPAGWTIQDNAGNNEVWAYDNPGSRTIAGGFSGQFAILDSDEYGSSGTQDVELITPAFDASATGIYTLEFDNQYRYISGSTAEIDVWNGTAWVNVYAPSASDGYSTPNFKSIDISSAAGGSSAAKVRFHYTGENDWWWAIDNISISMVTCGEVSDLTLNSFTATSANISWLAAGSETAWNVEYGPAGYTPGSGTLVAPAPTDTFVVVSGLTAGTSYDFYVQADCGGGDFGAWVGPFNVFTGYCQFSTSATSYYIDNFVTSDGATNISNVDSGLATDGYADSTQLFVSQYEGGTVDVDVSFGVEDYYTFGCNIWIDWNNDLVFDASEKVFASGTYTSNAIGTITVPVGTPLGDYTMRVVANYSNTNPSPCTNGINGEAEDYTFRVIPIPSCLPVSALGVTNVISGSADVYWTAGGSETSWLIEYGPEGFTPGSGTTVTAGTNQFTISPLTGSTSYDFYVQADCGGGDQSTWVGPFTFQTLCAPISALGFCEGFEPASTTEGCWMVIDGNDDDDTWDINYTSNPYNGDESAMIHTDYNSGDNDDWLITPNITLTGNEVMSFFYRVQSAYEPNDFEVLLSTTGIDEDDFTDTLMHLNAYDNTTYADTSLDLSAFTGDVFIAFHVPAGGEDGYRLYIDQVCIDICTPAPGTDGTMNVCRLDDTIDLGTVITAGEPNGVWSYAPNQQLISGSDFNIAGIAAGSYELEYVVTTACTSDTTTAVVNVFDASKAGNGGSVSTCNYGPFDLFDALAGTVDLGGTWYDATGAPLDGAIVSFNGEIAGSYNYDYVTSNGVCPEDTATVEIQLQDCAGLDEQQLQGFALYPNPTQDIVSVSYEGAGVAASLKLIDMRGAVVYADQVDFNAGKTYKMNLSNLEPGVYMLTIQGESAATVIRVIKN